MQLIAGLVLAAFAGLSVDARQEDTPQQIQVAVERVTQPITPPSWQSPPVVNPNDYPIFAGHLGIGAQVLVECDVDTEGAPRCRAVDTSVEGLGFENAAVAVAERGKLNPRRVGDEAVPSSIRLRVPFTPDNTAQTAPDWTGPEPTNANLLAGLVAAQSLARSPALEGQIDWGLHQIEPERARMVQQWITEMYIGRTNAKLMGRGIAMVLAKRGAQVMPADNPPDWAEWVREMDTALASIYTPELNFGPLQQRYCARYGCGTP
ncbi:MULTISPECIES: energy transducer TonB family protein [unclassified Brevundimonas]|uniref:energy transducer TonB family protein n=1 Tax=unclassified Brevundimonas TaxID=2622653 RepID=UPI0025C59CA5|nr:MULTISPECIES: energy transducer TonB [unclassified Brevundimonas]